jgi:hypothetical protein
MEKNPLETFSPDYLPFYCANWREWGPSSGSLKLRKLFSLPDTPEYSWILPDSPDFRIASGSNRELSGVG